MVKRRRCGAIAIFFPDGGGWSLMGLTLHTIYGRKITYGMKSGLSDKEFYEALRDTRGLFRTKSLFKETDTEKKYPQFFNMTYEDDKDTISFRKRYLELEDPTEYLPAMKLLGSWEHWKVLSNSPMFKRFFKEIREELKVRLESKALANVQIEANGSSAKSLDANKFIINYLKGNSSQPKSGRGRPSKDDVARELKAEADRLKNLEEDLERITNED